MNARRIGMFLIFAAVAIATVLLATGCAQVDAPERKPVPDPSPVLRSFAIGSRVRVYEFRDIAGRPCVLVRDASYGIALDCVRLPRLDYENLPDPGPE